MIRETEAGAYLGPGSGLIEATQAVASDPHFDVFDREGVRLVLVKCSRLPDDEDEAGGRYGIDFHRALPPFQGDSGFFCDWGEGAMPVNAYTYATHLPRALRFREFTAKIAFAAGTLTEYEAKREIYQDFYRFLSGNQHPVVLATPHSGQVHRPPDDYHPFPEAETDAWTARVAVRCRPTLPAGVRLLVSLHSTDYFGSLMDIGDFGLAANRLLPGVLSGLQERFAQEVTGLLPAYRAYILPYTRLRLEWMQRRWGTLDPEPLGQLSTASRFEIQSLGKVMANCLSPAERVSFSGLLKGMEKFWELPEVPVITLNSIFSGRKTAQLLKLAAYLEQNGFRSAVQVECSRFLARDHPELAAQLVTALVESLAAFL